MSTAEPTPNLGQEATDNAEPKDKEETVDMTFTKEVRQATKDVHKLTDVLVNAKFAIALSDDEVWYDGLLVFYELYKFFETNLPERLLPKELHRTAAFERDFDYFYGSDWRKSYEPRPAVQTYIAHLEQMAAKNEVLLFAFAFQMYMALMSGGQLLQKKRMIARKLWIFPKDSVEQVQQKQAETDAAAATARAAATAENDGIQDENDLRARPMPEQVTISQVGCEATYFPIRIPLLKNKLRRIFNDVYGKLDDEMRAEYIEQSRNVFRMNIELLRTVKGVNRANLKKLAIAVVFITSIYVAFKLAVK
ncbi:heme oxygenase 2 [Drosophila grimshawi]|uniref:Heme oxygenase n=1 Tax=Drosophila grimshawi TaxID=7222 RepID=B4JFH2_DROGR|nr:heme oxygenase 2 [Drosophila grimshawi]EDV93453.1 GH18266 [Drosophila grimshawi]